MTTFAGKTPKDLPPILGAKFWHNNRQISGVVLGSFNTPVGSCWNIKLARAIDVPGEFFNPPIAGVKSTDVVAVGNQKGFLAAIAASGAGDLRAGDKINIVYAGEKDTGQASPMTLFEVEIGRSDREPGQDF